MNTAATKKSFHTIALSTGQNGNIGLNEPVLSSSDGSSISIRELGKTKNNGGSFDCHEGIFHIKRKIETVGNDLQVVTYYIKPTSKDQIFLTADPRSSKLGFFAFCKKHGIDRAKVVIGPFSGEEPSSLLTENVRLLLKTNTEKICAEASGTPVQILLTDRKIPALLFKGEEPISIIHLAYEKWLELEWQNPPMLSIATYPFYIGCCTESGFELIPPQEIRLFIETDSGAIELEKVSFYEKYLFSRFKNFSETSKSSEETNLLLAELARIISIDLYDTTGEMMTKQFEQ